MTSLEEIPSLCRLSLFRAKTKVWMLLHARELLSSLI